MQLHCLRDKILLSIFLLFKHILHELFKWSVKRRKIKQRKKIKKEKKKYNLLKVKRSNIFYYSTVES